MRRLALLLLLLQQGLIEITVRAIHKVEEIYQWRLGSFWPRPTTFFVSKVCADRLSEQVPQQNARSVIEVFPFRIAVVLLLLSADDQCWRVSRLHLPSSLCYAAKMMT